MNKVIIVGRISNDLKSTLTKSNIPYLRFSVAVQRRYKNSQGNEIVDYVPIVSWNKTALYLEKNATKGVRVLVEGSFVSNSFTNSQGQRVVTNEVNAENVYILETIKDVENKRMNRNIQNLTSDETNNKKPTFYSEEITNETFEIKNQNDSSDIDDFSWDDVDNIY
ncbi:single-stranded DNA-binding protein [Mesomycoplasma neurolyticum]|uniref:Single-stranded DNA-binding protein n=1 Tax=Mesomycoplasma neurolyticum TaxID=2120 RepID=A0A449A5Y6_9BACT|nr:single-stranded DNA-binding protein [Mesomycoplasma neurolyticum]VEU59648.1 single strand binding protein [Mesomycoplasma neurolyticum]